MCLQWVAIGMATKVATAQSNHMIALVEIGEVENLPGGYYFLETQFLINYLFLLTFSEQVTRRTRIIW